MPDLIGAVVQLLGADADVAAIAGGRVFGGELPAAEAAHMPRGALVVKLSGGTSLTADSYVEADTQRIDLVAYGATPREADRLLELAAKVLRQVRRTVAAGVLIHWAKSAGGHLPGRDRDAAWPFAWHPFQVFHSLQEV